MNNKRFYNFTIIIYEDDENFNNQYFELVQQKEAIWIKHDQDIFNKDIIENEKVIHEAGELKKTHYHFVLKLKNACTISALAKKFDIPENMIEPIKKSFNGSLKYLIHYGYDDKFQYNIENVQSNSEKLKRRFEDLIIVDMPEVDKVINIQNFIESHPDYIKISILSKYVQKINMWDAFRRNYSFIKDLINEHNGEISAAKYHINNIDYFNINDDI